MDRVCLHQQRSELGRKVQYAYERGNRDWGGRSSMSEYVPRIDGKSGTLTTVTKDNYILEYVELDG